MHRSKPNNTHRRCKLGSVKRFLAPETQTTFSREKEILKYSSNMIKYWNIRDKLSTAFSTASNMACIYLVIVEGYILIFILDHSKGAILSTSMTIIIKELTIFLWLSFSETLQKTNWVILVELKYQRKELTLLLTGRHLMRLHTLQV